MVLKRRHRKRELFLLEVRRVIKWKLKGYLQLCQSFANIVAAGAMVVIVILTYQSVNMTKEIFKAQFRPIVFIVPFGEWEKNPRL